MTPELTKACLVSLVIRDLLVEHLPEYFGPNLDCACAISSHTLQLALDSFGIDALFVMGEMRSSARGRSYGEHCWVVVGKTVIDLTARQFSSNFPPLHVVPATDPCYRVSKTGRAALLEVNRDWTLHSPNAHRKDITRVLCAFAKLSV